MKKSNSSKGLIKRIIANLEITKEKLLQSLLAGFAFCFFIFIYSTTSVYFSNADEFSFSVWDFLPYYLLGFAVAFALIFIVLLFTKKFLFRLAFALTAGITICAYVQSFITTLTFSGLPGEGMSDLPSGQKILTNLVVWAIGLLFFGVLAFLRKRFELIRTVLSFALIAITVMQIFSLVPSAITYISSKDTKNKNTYFLTTENQLNLSSKENIVVLVLDSFDREFFREYLESDPNAMDEFDGFTYYDDNIASYPRTFPATTSMLSGTLNDFSLNRKGYFAQAYGNSPLFKDLKSNDYKMNLYLPTYYAYDNADVFTEYAANTSPANGYKVTDKAGLVRRMIFLSSYFWAPVAFKSEKISTSSFHEVGTHISDKKIYTVENSSDPDFYKRLTSEGLSANEEQNVFTFFHLRGCHPPFAMNENCEEVSSGSVTSLQQTTGCFNIIKEYIRQMKALGIYENSTIIITGDHSGSYAWKANLTEYEQPMCTALLVKQKGAHGTAFKTSNAPVSQENFLAEIIKSADIRTSTDYGKAYSDIKETDSVVRHHYFITSTGGKRQDEVVTYEIAGNSTNFDNWNLVSREHIGSIYD